MANKRILIDIKVTDAQASTNINKTKKAVDGLAKSTKVLEGRTSKNKATSGLNNTILQESGRLASDAAYGFQGMANNLGQLVSLFQISAKNSGGFLAALKDLKSSFFGVGGVLIGVQLLISFLPQLAKKFKESREQGDGLTKAVKALRKQYDDLKLSISESNLQLVEQDEVVDNLLTRLRRATKLNLMFRLFGNTDYLEKTVAQLQAMGVAVDMGFLKSIKNDRKAINDYFESLIEGSDKVGDAADKLLKRRQALEVNKILGVLTPVELAEENLALFIATQEATAVKEEEYVKSTEYLKLLARLEKAKMDARKKARKASKLASEIDSEGIVDIIDQENAKQKLLLKTVEKGFGETFSARKRAIKKESDLFFKNLKIERDEKERQAKLDEILYKRIQDNKLEALAVFTDGFSRLLGEQTAAGKAFASATALIDTYAGIAKVWKDETIQPFAFKVIAAAGILASGLSTVAKINAVNVSGRGSSSAAGGGTINAPDFNVVGTSETSQLAQAVGGREDSVVRAFVVGSEITSQQELDRKRINTAGL
tara:strand:- start:1433 stop:3058 length:1626 start_codon:yes stop_codon:yes gene_type:complete